MREEESRKTKTKREDRTSQYLLWITTLGFQSYYDFVRISQKVRRLRSTNKVRETQLKLSGVEFLVLDLTSQLRLAPGSSYSDLNQIFLEFNRAQKIENSTKSKNFCEEMFQMITEFIQPKKHFRGQVHFNSCSQAMVA